MTAELKRPTSQKPVYLQVADQIQQLINQGSLMPGDQLLSERELAAKLNVSRTSVRQALATLEGRGIIEVTPRNGAFVRCQSLKGAVEPLIQILYQQREQAAHLFEVRQIIETQAVRLATQRRTEADLKRLRRLNRDFAASLQQGDIAFEANTNFHHGLVETAKNPLLTEIMGTLIKATLEVYVLVRHQSLSTMLNLDRFVREHEHIIDAIKHQEADLAVSLLAKHIDDARKRAEAIIQTSS